MAADSNSRISLGYTIVDAFTKTAFTGNPAAVIVLDDQLVLPDATLQLIGREFNLSETTFLVPIAAGPRHGSARYSLRWFTPAVEAPLCGHATLASAYVLFHGPCSDLQAIEFETLAGTLTARRLDDGRIEVELPGRETRELNQVPGVDQAAVLDVLCAALGISEGAVRCVEAGQALYGHYLLVEIDKEVGLEALEVNTDQLVSPHIQY
jgi:PhzF family phenazine biosynthesis protein